VSCPFCLIAAGLLEAEIVSETEHTLAFRDLHPVNPGHTLVIPKTHYKDVSDTPDEILAELMVHAGKIAASLGGAGGERGFNILNASGGAAQQSVFHLHFHVVPRFEGDGKNLWFRGEDAGL